MQRLKNRAQYEAAMAGGTIARTAHFVLHRLVLDVPAPAAGPDSERAQALFAVRAPWMGAVVPKRWARRAVTRNGIKRQIYSLSATFEDRLPAAAHVVRLRTAFAREQFPSAWSEALKKAVRAELLQLFGRAVAVIPASPAVIPGAAASPVVIPASLTVAPASPAVIPAPRLRGGQAPAGIQGAQDPKTEALDPRLRGDDGHDSRLRRDDGLDASLRCDDGLDAPLRRDDGLDASLRGDDGVDASRHRDDGLDAPLRGVDGKP